MLLSWDLGAGALYIGFGGEVARTVEADGNGNTLVDLNAGGRVVGVEVIAYAYPSALEAVMGWPGFPAGDVPLLRACFGEPAEVRAMVPWVQAGTVAGAGRSTPAGFGDRAEVTDAAGGTWRYSEAADVWRLVDRHVRRPLPTSARSWQRLEAERGPLSPVA